MEGACTRIDLINRTEKTSVLNGKTKSKIAVVGKQFVATGYLEQLAIKKERMEQYG